MSTLVIGKPIEGRVMCPSIIWTIGTTEEGTAAQHVAVQFVPHDGDEDFKEPLVVMIPIGRVDEIIGLLKNAQAMLKSLPHGSK